MGFGNALRQPSRQPGEGALPPWDPGSVISSGGGGQGSTAGQGAGVQNAYDATGNLSSILSREGIDIGPQPDFWKDLNSIVTRLRPRQMVMPAQQQVQALRAPAEPQAQERPAFMGRGQAGPSQARFATIAGLGPGSAGTAYQAWVPGMAYAPGAAPFATYSG